MDIEESSGCQNLCSGDVEMDFDISQFETCGICSDVVIDRGVLDCCEHWFCFTCIDNWAAITNCCPLCRTEFRLITCSPVFHSVGSNNEEEYSLLGGDDDWYVEGEHNTLSFPSYYIDEDAVSCLDSGLCKVRSGLEKDDLDVTFDTSIACDSCDKWYHALCVGYNPEYSTEQSWLCPCCVSSELQDNSDGMVKQNTDDALADKRYDLGINGGSMLSGELSVSIADDGETAVVVSFGRMPKSDENIQVECLANAHTGVTNSLHTACSDYTLRDSLCGLPSEDCSVIAVEGEKENLNQFVHQSAQLNEPPKIMLQQNLLFSPIREPAMATHIQKNPEPLHAIDIKDSYSKSSTLNGNNVIFHEEQPATYYTAGCDLPNDNDLADTTEFKDTVSAELITEITKNRNADNLLNHSQGAKISREEYESPLKKAKMDLEPVYIPLGSHNAINAKSNASSRALKSCLDKKPDFDAREASKCTDIMSIVQEATCTSENAKKREKSGIRVKKVLRRKEENSSALLQEIQEIKNVVDTNINSFGQDASFNEKLLAAFKVAIRGSADAQPKRLDASQIRAKKTLLQKGTIRENLTKKLYASSVGRRRSTWHRDWEVEFWKYRCSSEKKTEKIEMLHSVLELLKRTNDGVGQPELKPQQKADTSNSILSRVYLADASVMPRKDDLKPLSVLSSFSHAESRNQVNGMKVKDSKVENKGPPPTSSMHLKESSIAKGNKFSVHGSSNLLEGKNSQKQTGQCGNSISDKRKWALEVLARKNASAASATAKEHCKDDTSLKGNYPLLTQLPTEMRPVPSASRNNNVPLSVRQAQLYRITEYLLKKANLRGMRRCAETELAVADAINVEKGILERSSSKMVYTNLCAQFLRQQAKQVETVAEKQAENIGLSSDGKSNLAREALSEGSSCGCSGMLFSDAEEALRLAGLSSDSPPSSPDRKDLIADGRVAVKPISSEYMKVQQQAVEANDSLVLYQECFKPEVDIPELPKEATLESGTENSQSTVPCADELKYQPAELPMTLLLQNDLSEQKSPGESCSLVGTSCNQSELLEQRSFSSANTDTTAMSIGAPNPGSNAIDSCNTSAELSERPEKGVEQSNKSIHADEIQVMTLCKTRHDRNSSDEAGDVIQQLMDQKLSGGSSCRDSIKVTKNSLDEVASLNGNDEISDHFRTISKKVEAYAKEHVRPLCKSGVITVEQYRWAVKKTTDKVMKYHCHAKDASFLIKEGDKVKRLALEYAEASYKI